MMFALDTEVASRLRDRLQAVGYTVEGVAELLGPVAHAALHRNETTPGLRVTAGGGPLATLVRLFLLQIPVARRHAAEALPDLLEPLCAAKVLHAYGEEVCALVDLRPYGVASGPGAGQDWWVVADLTPGMDGVRPTLPPDHVLGVNSAATTLAQLTPRRPVDRALDIGTGSGIQALHLLTHARHVIGTDVNERALAMARATAALNGIPTVEGDPTRPRVPGLLDEPMFELRAGSLFEPVDAEEFDLIVTNPPFVISPRGALTYRDSGYGGDEVCRRIVVEAAQHLRPGGVCVLLANWLHVRGEDWRDRLSGWVGRTGGDAWVVQREVSDPAEYVELWLKDAGHHGATNYRQLYDEWVAWLEAQAAEGIGFGWIVLRRPAGEAPGPRRVRVEEWTGPVQQPLGEEVSRWLDTVELLRSYDDAALLGSRLVVADHVDQEQLGRPGAAHPEHVVLRQRAGMRRAMMVDTAEAGFVGACDATLTADEIIGALASLLEEDVDGLRGRLVRRVRGWLEEGYLSVSS